MASPLGNVRPNPLGGLPKRRTPAAPIGSGVVERKIESATPSTSVQSPLPTPHIETPPEQRPFTQFCKGRTTPLPNLPSIRLPTRAGIPPRPPATERSELPESDRHHVPDYVLKANAIRAEFPPGAPRERLSYAPLPPKAEKPVKPVQLPPGYVPPALVEAAAVEAFMAAPEPPAPRPAVVQPPGRKPFNPPRPPVIEKPKRTIANRIPIADDF
jgi:hypothetical protein